MTREMICFLMFLTILICKKKVAAAMNMKIMKSSWIYEVWRENMDDDWPAISPHFDKHKVPVFYNLRVTSTGLTLKEKNEVEDMVKFGGGIYHGEINPISIDVVIAKKDATMTQTLHTAIKLKNDCLCVEWIHDCAMRNCTLPFDNYRINLHTEMSNKFAAIKNETATSESNSRKRKNDDTGHESKDLLSYKAIFDKLNVQEAERAGNFLDGCNVRHLAQSN